MTHPDPTSPGAHPQWTAARPAWAVGPCPAEGQAWTPHPYPAAVGQAMTSPQELFSVRVHKHYGVLVAWYQQTYTVSGTRAQCERALRQAQVHNLLAGWWSPLSLLAMNWIALASNASESARLRRAVTGYRPYPTPQPPVATAPYPYPLR